MAGSREDSSALPLNTPLSPPSRSSGRDMGWGTWIRKTMPGALREGGSLVCRFPSVGRGGPAQGSRGYVPAFLPPHPLDNGAFGGTYDVATIFPGWEKAEARPGEADWWGGTVSAVQGGKWVTAEIEVAAGAGAASFQGLQSGGCALGGACCPRPGPCSHR